MIDFVQTTSTTKTLRFKYWHGEDGRVFHHPSAAWETWQDARYSNYILNAPHVGQGRYAVATPVNVALVGYNFSVVEYVDGTLANDTPLGGHGEAFDMRYVAGRPVLLGSPGHGGGVLTVTASVAQVATTAGGVVKAISQFQNTKNTFTWRVVNAAGVGVNLASPSTHTIEFKVHDRDGDTEIFDVRGSDVVLSEFDSPGVFDVISVTVQSAKVPSSLLPGVYHYKLWDLTSEFVYGSGDYVLLRAPRP